MSLVSRFIVIGGLTPLLMHIGYSIDWKQIIVITWGGLRGAVGLALALVVAQTPEISLDRIGSKVTFVAVLYIRGLMNCHAYTRPCTIVIHTVYIGH